MTKTLQQIKDEAAKGRYYSNWDEFESYQEQEVIEVLDEVAIRYAQEVNKELVGMLEELHGMFTENPEMMGEYAELYSNKLGRLITKHKGGDNV